MKKSMILFLVVFPLAGGNFWSITQLDQVFAFVNIGKSEEAISLVQTWGVTPHDFGLDILAQGRGAEALIWFDAIIPLSTEDRDTNRVARAWVLRAQGYTEDAFIEAMECTSSENLLAQARAHYLLALMSKNSGDLINAFSHARQARDLFEIEQRYRGVEYCNMLLDSWSRSGKSTNQTSLSDGSQGPPPTDSGGA